MSRAIPDEARHASRRGFAASVVAAVTFTVVVPRPALGMRCYAFTSNPEVIQVQPDFFVVDALHYIGCERSTRHIHVLGELTRDGVIVDTGTADCIYTATCGPAYTQSFHARHNHLHLWHGWTSGYHRHSDDDRRRKVAKVRSEICLETRLRPLMAARPKPPCRVGSGKLGSEGGPMIEIESPRDVLVAAGPDWQLKARFEGERIFYRVVGPYGGGGSFSDIGAGEPPSVGVKMEWGAAGSSGQPWYLMGSTTADVAAVRVEMTDGTGVDVPTIASEAFPVRFFVALLPSHLRALALVALDASGAELERLDASATLDIPPDA